MPATPSAVQRGQGNLWRALQDLLKKRSKRSEATDAGMLYRSRWGSLFEISFACIKSRLQVSTRGVRGFPRIARPNETADHAAMLVQGSWRQRGKPGIEAEVQSNERTQINRQKK